MLKKELYKRILKFIKLAINNNSVSVIPAYQNAPKSKKPFITVHISSVVNEGTVTRLDVDANNIQKYMYTMNANVRLQAYSDDYFESSELLEAVRFAFDTDLKIEIFKSEIAYVRDLTDIINLPTSLDSINEFRSVYDFVLRYVSEIATNVDLVKQIEMTNEVSNDTIIVETDTEIEYNVHSTQDTFYSLEEE